jgi:membrane protein YdbS with pleckstrin-like domain
VRGGQRTELIGAPTGIEDTYLGARSRVPDPGWAVNDAARIRAVASPVWLFFTYWNVRVDRWLLDALSAGGGRVTDRVVTPYMRVYRVDTRD